MRFGRRSQSGIGRDGVRVWMLLSCAPEDCLAIAEAVAQFTWGVDAVVIGCESRSKTSSLGCGQAEPGARIPRLGGVLATGLEAFSRKKCRGGEIVRASRAMSTKSRRADRVAQFDKR